MPYKEAKVGLQEIEIACELSAAERESETVSERDNHDEVMTVLRTKIATAQNCK